jgi:hypothetical protein
MKINHLRTGIVFLLFVLNSCSKDKHPYINIIRPFNGQVFNAADTIEIDADLWDSDAVTSEYLVVTKENITNDTVINFTDYTFSPGTYHLTKNFISQSNTDYKIVVSAVGHGHLIGDTIRVKSN